MLRFVTTILIVCTVVAGWFFYSEVHKDVTTEGAVSFAVEQGESVGALGARLEEEGIIRHGWVFRRYISWKGLDKQINFGSFNVEAPATVANIVAALTKPTTSEQPITILPGWDLRDIANYFEQQGIATEKELYKLTGKPVSRTTSHARFDVDIMKEVPLALSLEGYLAPDTYNIFVDEELKSILTRLISHRDGQITEQMREDIKKSGRSFHEIMTMAGLVEREVRGKKDRARVADIFWRRFDAGWGMQADSTVHYVTGKKGDVFTTAADRAIDNAWNTYKYAGLPPGPISNPSIESIMAAIYPIANDNWYFLTTLEGDVKYGKTLEQHNANAAKYLR